VERWVALIHIALLPGLIAVMETVMTALTPDSERLPA
jgi:hypothetical protein